MTKIATQGRVLVFSYGIQVRRLGRSSLGAASPFAKCFSSRREARHRRDEVTVDNLRCRLARLKNSDLEQDLVAGALMIAELV
jgi:hypothetical protein